MTSYNTGNPIGSTDPRDLYDNAENLDEAVNTRQAESWDDRFGVARKTWWGMENEFDQDQSDRASEYAADKTARDTTFDADQADREQRWNLLLANSGYDYLADYAAGIEVTEYNQVIRDAAGELWRASAGTELPYTTTGAGLPEGGAFVAIGDADIRNDLAAGVAIGQGALLVRGAVIYVDTIADLQALNTSEMVDGQQVQVKEYHAGTGVGGGGFYWDAQGNEQSNGGTILGTAPQGRWKRKDQKKLVATEFGARPGHNVTSELQALSDAANSLGSGFSIELDCGEAEVFTEIEDPSPGTPYYQSSGNIISLLNCHRFTIDATGCYLTTAQGLHYGSFDPETGEPMPTRQTASLYRAELGSVIELRNCSQYTVTNPRFFGNNTTFIMGAAWGDTGWQLRHAGVYEFNCVNGTVVNAECNYFGLDGMYIGGAGTYNITHINPICHYNGRQGLSWTGGSQLTLINPSYCHTGKGGVSSSPRAGIDIEDNGAGCYGLEMINPELLNNAGADFLSLKTTDNINIRGGVLASNDASVWVESKGVKFFGTTFHGQLRVNSAGVEYHNCVITQELYKGYGYPGNSSIDNTNNCVFDGCEIYLKRSNGFYILSGAKLRRTNFHLQIDNPPPRERMGVLEASELQDVRFIQEYTNLDPIVEQSGERTFIVTNFGGSLIKGYTAFEGSALAIDGRIGQVNFRWSTPESLPLETRMVTAETEDPLIITLGTSSALHQIRNGHNMLFVASSSPGTSSAGSRHDASILTSGTRDGNNYTYEETVSGGFPAIRISAGATALTGTTWTVTRLAMISPSTISLT